MADFAIIKERVSLEQAAQMLGLKLTERNGQLRGPCPRCESGGDRALALTPSKRIFYCFNSTAGGSVIDLVAHIRAVDLKHAAEELEEHFLDRKPSTAPPALPTADKKEGQLQALTYLEADHPAVAAVGFDADTAQALGIGFSPKGMMKGLVAVPVRLEDGTLAGYIGLIEVAKLPPKFHLGNVVPFAKKSA